MLEKALEGPLDYKEIKPDHPKGNQSWIFVERIDVETETPIPQFKSIYSSASAFFIVQFLHPYMTTGKTIALTRLTFVSKVMSLLFNMLSRLVIAFLPRSKHLLISWLQLLSAVIWGPPKNKVSHCFHCFPCFPIYLPWSDGTRCHDLSFLNIQF